MSEIKITVDLCRDAKGLGILMDKKGKPPNQKIWVDEIVAGTPAAACGKIEVGDTLLEVNKQEVDKMTFEAVMTELKKDDVQLLFLRKPEEESSGKKSRRLSMASMAMKKKEDDKNEAKREGKEVKRRNSIMQMLGAGKDSLKKVKVTVQRDETGLGIVLDHKGQPPQQQIWVDELVEGTPAHKCGKIKRGDQLTEVGGENIKWMPIEEVVKLLGTPTVKLTFLRNKEKAEEFTRDSDKKQLFDARRFSQLGAEENEKKKELEKGGGEDAPASAPAMSEAEKKKARMSSMGAFASSSTPAGRRASLGSKAKQRRQSSNAGERRAFEGSNPMQDDSTQEVSLTPEQQKDLDTFEAAIRAGLDVLKHGRSGKPHLRTIFAPVERPSWVKPGTENFRCVCWGKSEGDGLPQVTEAAAIAVADLTGVKAGKQTEVFKRSQCAAIDEDLCLSLISKTRSLDLQCESTEQRQMLLKGFQLLAFRDTVEEKP